MRSKWRVQDVVVEVVYCRARRYVPCVIERARGGRLSWAVGYCRIELFVCTTNEWNDDCRAALGDTNSGLWR